MKKRISLTKSFLTCLLMLIFAAPNTAFSKRIEIKDGAAELPETAESSKTGRQEAAKYFSGSGRMPAQAGGARDHYLGLHVGGFIDSDAYEWGVSDKQSDVAKLNFGVTYRMGEWINAADMLVRVDFNTFEVDDSKPMKMSVMAAAVFPDSASRFPLYFGAGIGPGIFFRQTKKESPLSLDYQLIAGARMFEVFEQVGFFVEGGMKNHLHLLSDGQLNSYYFSLGTLFTF